jgi:alpha-tubulin suppressor-like RCC1 family protein
MDDGLVTIYEVDYASGRILTNQDGSLKEIGRYPVNPAFLAAIRSFPYQFKAGAIGPDAFPDILTGQTGIHPDNSLHKICISNDWLQNIWDTGLQSPRQQVRAFVAGFLTHAAGDLFGHTFINDYAGGSFELGENALKHYVLESYIDSRTPKSEPDFYEISLEGVEDFIYQNLTIGPFVAPSSLGALVSEPGYPYNYAPPRYFLGLQGWVIEKITDLRNWWRQTSQDYVDRINRLRAEAKSLLTSDPIEAKKRQDEALELAAELKALEATKILTEKYLTNWRDDITAGLKAWGSFSLDFARELFLNPQGIDRDRLSGICQDYVNAHLLSMGGAPDIVGDYLAAMKSIRDTYEKLMPDWAEEVIKFLTTDFELYLLEKALGIAWDILTEPIVHFDLVMNRTETNLTCRETTLENFNREVLKISDSATFTTQTYDWRNIPAMFNSVTMMKLSLLGRAGAEALLRDLEEKGYTTNTLNSLLRAKPYSVPLILGYMQSLDESEQWCEDDQMLFVRDPCVYRKLFMSQIGQKDPNCPGGCDLPPDGTITTRLNDNPLSGGGRESLVIKSDGSLWEWGSMFRGELGHGRYQDIPTPGLIPSPIRAVSCGIGLWGAVALASDGTVWVWGERAPGQAGIYNNPGPYVPTQAPNLSNITMIAVGDIHYLALRSNGTVWTWGSSSSGRCGLGNFQPPRPWRVAGLNYIKYIGAGADHSLAVDTSGRVWAWGSNYGGELGDGTKTERDRPVQVQGIENVIAVDGGEYWSMALKADGTVWAWGRDIAVGPSAGTWIEHLHPAQVMGLERIIAIGAGRQHGAALRDDGTVWVWGNNHLDQLGLGKRTGPVLQPIRVSGLPKITVIADGGNRTLALDETGGIWIWGDPYPTPTKVLQR